jgi:xanthine/uracil permease
MDIGVNMSLLCILKVIVVGLILMLVGTNLIGFIVRGFFWIPPSVDSPTEGVHELLSRESKRMSVANGSITFFSVVLAAAYLSALFYFWNVLLAVAGGLIMASRIPDLVWEIRTGSKVTRQSAPKGLLYILATIIQWVSFPLIWYALC